MNSKTDTSLIDGVAPAVGLRERGKQRRRHLIKEAARSVFYELGYQDATTREIAERAEVSLGTLFAYAPTKSELLLMIVNDDLEAERGNEFDDALTETPLIETLMRFSQKNFMYWGKHPEIARQARREISSVLSKGKVSGPEAVRFAANKNRLQASLAQLIERKRAAGSIQTKADIQVIVDMWWCICNQQIHTWLADEKPSVSKGMKEIQRLYHLMMECLIVDESEKFVPEKLSKVSRKIRP